MRAGVLGVTGAVGQQFVRFLAGHPYFKIKLLTASPKSAGKKYSEVANWLAEFSSKGIPEPVRNMVVEETRVENIVRAKLNVVFCALPAKEASEILPELAKKGIIIIDKSSAFR